MFWFMSGHKIVNIITNMLHKFTNQVVAYTKPLEKFKKILKIYKQSRKHENYTIKIWSSDIPRQLFFN